MVILQASFFIVLAIILGSVTYTLYPLDDNEAVSIVAIASSLTGGGRDAGGEPVAPRAPGFVAGVAGVSSISEEDTIRGKVVGHGFIVVKGHRIPFMKVESGDSVYFVVMSERVAEGIIESGRGSVRIVEMPTMMMGHYVTVKGLRVGNTNIVVAKSMFMNWDEWGGGWGRMPGHHGRGMPMHCGMGPGC